MKSFINKSVRLFVVALSSLTIAGSVSGGELEIKKVEPTPLFPRPPAGQSLQQLVRLYLDNPDNPIAAVVRISVGSQVTETQDLGILATGESVVTIKVPDITAPKPVSIELLTKNGKLLASQKVDWQPQKKWTFYSVSYSHQDLGFADYPHRLRTSIRHENILLPLRFCRETEGWPEDAKYRFNIEGSEAITSFISFKGKDAARELAHRIGEGRIQLMGLHNTSNTEQLSHELLARLFYMTGRHAVDLLGEPSGRCIQQTDVLGLTASFPTYAREAGFDYCFHGFNRLAMPNVENGELISNMKKLDSEVGRHVFSEGNEPNFYWEGPDGQQLLKRATTYERHDLLNNPYEENSPEIQDPARVELLIRAHEKNKWPFDIILSQDGGDFILVRRTIANRALKWNEEYIWPHIRMATFDDYFQAVEKEMADKNIKLNTLTGDENNQWSDQDYAAARVTGKARRLTEALPATETLATVAQAVTGGGKLWIDLFQGYHRLLQYYEHTNGKSDPNGNMCWYETELEENREMVNEAGDYQQRAFVSASQRLSSAITLTGERNLIVFNPLPYLRTDIVRTDLPADLVPVDATSGAKPLVQQLSDGSMVFIVENIPAIGYKTYQLIEGQSRKNGFMSDSVLTLENKFYRIQVNRVTGTINSLFDKTLDVELIETNSPHAFNEYLYEFRTKTDGQNSNSVWSRMEKADTVSVIRGPVADVLTVTGKAGGVKQLKQTVTLYHDLQRIDFGIWLDKLPFDGSFPKQHEAVFVALPFAIPNFTINHELPGAVVEPYRLQVEGSATDHYAICGFTDISNDKYGITVSPIEGSLVCYGMPTSTPLGGGIGLYNFKRERTYPTTSRLYLYLLNNMFAGNIAADQPGPVSFQWVLRSHAGDWKAGGSDRFGRSVLQPLIAWRTDGKHRGILPVSNSFMNVDVSNVMCSVIKPAEANGHGFIIRLNETTGKETIATVTLPMLRLESAYATSLVENDRQEKYPVIGNSFKIKLPKFGVKTIRITCAVNPITVTGLNAKAVADMQVELKWKYSGKKVSHFNIYRDAKPECTSTLLNFIGQTVTGSFTDRPQLNIGGWLRSCLIPETTYYYRVVPVDYTNNSGVSSAVVKITTLSSEKANLKPMIVEGVTAIGVSPLDRHLNFVNLLFRTACEPDIVQYEIHRSLQPGFTVCAHTLIGVVKSEDIPARSGGNGESAIKYENKEYDHAMFSDTMVEPSTVYYYQVRAVDKAGQKGMPSKEVSIRTKDLWFPPIPRWTGD